MRLRNCFKTACKVQNGEARNKKKKNQGLLKKKKKSSKKKRIQQYEV